MTATIRLWRIATETRTYRAADLTGAGAAHFPGRWNAPGEFVLYATQSLALAVLETAAHIDSVGLPLNKYVVQLAVPSAVWKRRVQLKLATLDRAWSAIPAGKASVDAGSQWYQSGSSALLLVPSVLVPEETVVLINATHRDADKLTARVMRAFEYNRLFRS